MTNSVNQQAHIILNGGNPIKDCPTDWSWAQNWEYKVNEGVDPLECPTWKFDCGFKLDFDGPAVSLSSRFYPPKTDYGPQWDGSLNVYVFGKKVCAKEFNCETLEELHAQVKAFCDTFQENLVNFFAQHDHWP